MKIKLVILSLVALLSVAANSVVQSFNRDAYLEQINRNIQSARLMQSLFSDSPDAVWFYKGRESALHDALYLLEANTKYAPVQAQDPSPFRANR